MIAAGSRVEHPSWPSLDGDRPQRRHEGRVVRVANAWHADVLFDGWPYPVRAAIASLEPIACDEHLKAWRIELGMRRAERAGERAIDREFGAA